MCKFGDYCSFLHGDQDISTEEKDIKEMKVRLLNLENQVKDKELEIERMNDKINALEENILQLNEEVGNTLEKVKSVIEIAVKEVTEKVVETI